MSKDRAYYDDLPLDADEQYIESQAATTEPSPSNPVLYDLNGNKIEYWLSVYAVSRHYGGPEEGGWFYNWYDFTGVSQIAWTGGAKPTDSTLDEKEVKLLAPFKDKQPRFNIYSAANDGPQYEMIPESYPGQEQSKERPHYE